MNSPSIWSQSWANQLAEKGRARGAEEVQKREGGKENLLAGRYRNQQEQWYWFWLLPPNLTAVLSCLLSWTPFLWYKRGWIFCWSPPFKTLGHCGQRIMPPPPLLQGWLSGNFMSAHNCNASHWLFPAQGLGSFIPTTVRTVAFTEQKATKGK